ncbi:hypothetical protein ES703_32786 [subsurface metagenome]
MVGRRRLFTDQQLIALYKKGMIDREIADELGIHKSTVSKRRMRLGLKGHEPKLLFTDQQLIELHEQGFNDREIGEKLGVTPQAVGLRRNRLGLKPIRKHRNKAYKRKRLFTDQQLIELHEQGFNDREIAEKLGVGRRAVGYRRNRLGLKPIRKHRNKAYTRKASSQNS